MKTLSLKKELAKRPLGKSGLSIAPLVLGGNVFGWTADQPTTFALLDRFIDAGLNAIDTADVYSFWVPGNKGGESETVIGNWFKANPARRAQAVLITKVGHALATGPSGLSAKRIVEAAEGSLRRLQTDYIDLYLSHAPDPNTPIEETLRAYEALISQGKVRAIGASNYSAEQLRQALDSAGTAGLPRYEVLQPEYNLYSRSSFDGPLHDLCVASGLGVITYFALASGFLTGKYRSKADLSKSPRGMGIERFLTPRGLRILDALDVVSKAHNAQPAEVALAWVIAREGVTAPIASATSIAQLDSLIRSTQLSLTASDLTLLNAASAPA